MSRPGITNEDVCGFLEKYTANTPKTVLKVFASQFMDILPDKNEFSRLDLMILANTLKNNFEYKNDADLGFGICNVVKNYDRSVLSFEELRSTVEDTSKNILELDIAAEEMAGSMDSLNSRMNNKCLFEFRKEYASLLSEVNKNLEQNNLSEVINYFNEAIICNPERSEAYFGLAGVYERQGYFEDAVDVLEMLVDSRPCDVIRSRAFLEKARCYIALGNPDRALQDLEQVDDNINEKYSLQKQCRSGYEILGKETIKNFMKKAYHCYLRPAFSYWKSTKKKKGAGSKEKNADDGFALLNVGEQVRELSYKSAKKRAVNRNEKGYVLHLESETETQEREINNLSDKCVIAKIEAEHYKARVVPLEQEYAKMKQKCSDQEARLIELQAKAQKIDEQVKILYGE
ncbi:tetratricopeptide repeat protein [Candidatus Woesearchaeota archaeon]|nr:tetratricopeptide repeat protein [Candidatus Woesearchaeota archaeon]